MENEKKEWSFDARRALLDSILALSPSDLPGIYYKFPSSTDLDLDTLSSSDLSILAAYVSACYRPWKTTISHQCNLCLGLWSNTPLIPCGNSKCTVRIHEACFGCISRDHNGVWYCPSCATGTAISCSFCLLSGGALKPLDDGNRWGHLLCALVVPETTVADVPTLEPINGYDTIPTTRLRLICTICRKKGGVCMECEEEGCHVTMHPQCGADAGSMLGTNTNPLALFCEKHIPKDAVAGAKRFISEDDLMGTVVTDMEDDDEVDEQCGFMMTAAICDMNDVSVPRALTRRISESEIVPPQLSYPPSKLAKKINALPRTFVEYKPVQEARTPTTSSSMLPKPTPLKKVAALTVPSLSTFSSSSSAPEFPQGKDVIGAIVEVYWKTLNAWYTATVVDFSSRNRNHNLSYFIDGYTEWFRMRSHNTHVLRMPYDTGRIIRLHRINTASGRIWCMKPKVFSASKNSSPRK